MTDPLRWKRPRRVFVNSMSDLFHKQLSFEDIFRVFHVMQQAPQHTFQVLTKRPKRMKDFIEWLTGFYERLAYVGVRWPLPNIWLGVSVEDQATADQRIPVLMETPAAVRWVSAEPLLGSVSLNGYYKEEEQGTYSTWLDYLDWVICGGESGNEARPMHPDWPASLRDQCVAADISFFFKQWGSWAPHPLAAHPGHNNGAGLYVLPDGSSGNQGDYWAGRAAGMNCVGKKAAGRRLDGHEWNEYPGEAL